MDKPYFRFMDITLADCPVMLEMLDITVRHILRRGSTTEVIEGVMLLRSNNIIAHLSIPSVIPEYFRNSSPATLSGVKKRNIFNPEHPVFMLGVLSERRDEIKATRCLR